MKFMPFAVSLRLLTAPAFAAPVPEYDINKGCQEIASFGGGSAQLEWQCRKEEASADHPLGWEIMASENTACISSAFRRTCLLLGKFPKVAYLDNGKAFRAKFFKGTADFRQAGFLGLYRDLGCEVRAEG